MPFRRRKFYGRENNQMTAVVIDGKKKALEIRENLAREIAEAKARPVGSQLSRAVMSHHQGIGKSKNNDTHLADNNGKS